MSLYAEYIAERLGDQIVETDKGFASYRIQDDRTVYVLDVYVRPEYRKTKALADLLDKVVEVAKKERCVTMIASVIPTARGSTHSLKVCLTYGMVLDSSTNNFVLLRKVI